MKNFFYWGTLILYSFCLACNGLLGHLKTNAYRSSFIRMSSHSIEPRFRLKACESKLNKRFQDRFIVCMSNRMDKGDNHHDSSNKRLRFDTLKDSSESSFVLSMSRRAKETFEISSSERADLNILLKQHLSKMTPRPFASALYSIGLMKLNSKNWDAISELRLLIEKFEDVHSRESLTSEDIVMIIVGFSRLQADYSKVFNGKTMFLNRLAAILNTVDIKIAGDILWGLGNMGGRWNDYPQPLKDSIINSITKYSKGFNAYSLSSTVWALAKMGLRWFNLSREIRSQIMTSLCIYSTSFSPQQSSKTLWALGTLGASAEECPHGLLQNCLTNVNKIKKSQIGGGVSASQSLTGLAKLSISWNEVSAELKSSIWEQSIRVFQSTNDRGIANAVWALGTMGAIDLPKHVKDAMYTGVLRAIQTSSSWSLSNVVWGFAKMKLSWSELPVAVQEVVMSNVARVEPTMNNVDVGVLTWALGSLETPIDTLPDRFLDPLFRAITRNLSAMRPQELANTIWGLSGAYVSWNSLPSAMCWSINVALRRVGEEMSPQEVANSCYGMALIAFDAENTADASFRGTHESLLNLIRKKGRGMDSCTIEFEQLRTFAHYLHVMKYVTDLKRIPEDLLMASSQRSDSSTVLVRGSNLQDRVSDGLQQALLSADLDDLQVVSEFSSFNGAFPVDAAVRYKGNVIGILEVDGPQHYR